MANIASAKKRIRSTNRKTMVNTNRVSKIRTYEKKVEEAITEGNHELAMSALKVVQPELMAGVNKGVIHKSTMSRKISQYNKRIKALQ
jgi:small subunit ribosomal protein S20